MQVFVFAYDRFTTMTTSAALESDGVDHVVLCHSPDDIDKFVDGGTVKRERLVATGNSKGLAYQRNFALDAMADGEWALFLVDDLIRITTLSNYATAQSPLPITVKNSGDYQKRFKTPLDMKALMSLAGGLTKRAERNGAHLVGFAGIDNALFRRAHFGVNVLADGRAWLVRKSHLRFDENAQMIDDLAWTALNIESFGVVIVDQWILPHCRRYTAGGFGSIDERMEQKLREANYLVGRFPDLVAFRQKAGWPLGSHVALRQGSKPRIK